MKRYEVYIYIDGKDFPSLMCELDAISEGHAKTKALFNTQSDSDNVEIFLIGEVTDGNI